MFAFSKLSSESVTICHSLSIALLGRAGCSPFPIVSLCRAGVASYHFDPRCCCCPSMSSRSDESQNWSPAFSLSLCVCVCLSSLQHLFACNRACSPQGCRPATSQRCTRGVSDQTTAGVSAAERILQLFPFAVPCPCPEARVQSPPSMKTRNMDSRSRDRRGKMPSAPIPLRILGGGLVKHTVLPAVCLCEASCAEKCLLHVDALGKRVSAYLWGSSRGGRFSLPSSGPCRFVSTTTTYRRPFSQRRDYRN